MSSFLGDLPFIVIDFWRSENLGDRHRGRGSRRDLIHLATRPFQTRYSSVISERSCTLYSYALWMLSLISVNRSLFIRLHSKVVCSGQVRPAVANCILHEEFARSIHQSINFGMPPRRQPIAVNGKRKASEEIVPTPKKAKPADRFSDRSRYKDSATEEEHGIVLREFYPPELTNERAKQYIAGTLERPIKTLETAIEETREEREKIEVAGAVVFWFKSDLRTKDNHGLHLASEKAKVAGAPLIGVYLVSPQDFQAHVTAPVRVDFILRTLAVLKADLAKLDIPLHVEVVEKRKQLPNRLIDLSREWRANHVFCNTEYEVDELRREAALTRDCLSHGIDLTTAADSCVVSPGELSSKSSGNQFAVYTPWFRAWCAYVNSNPGMLDEYPRPAKNPATARKDFKHLFDCSIPEAPPDKKLNAEERKRFQNMWPAGEHEADQRLKKFTEQRIKKYAETRNFPTLNGTSVISVHLAAGTLAARTCVRAARDANTSRAMNIGNSNILTWISEVAWRDFYRHVLAHWPFVW